MLGIIDSAAFDAAAFSAIEQVDYHKEREGKKEGRKAKMSLMCKCGSRDY